VKILFLTPYPPDKAPSQRFRFELFIKEIAGPATIGSRGKWANSEIGKWGNSELRNESNESSGSNRPDSNYLKIKSQSFLSEKGWKILYSKGNALQKIWAILMGFGRRKWMLLQASSYDYVFIHRELTPFGPPIFEWFLAKVLRKKIIYDFDDAIWMDDGHDNNPLWTWLKWRSKVASICKWSWKVSAGNEYLADFARQYCDQVVVMPTVVDTGRHTITLRESQGDKRVPQGQKNGPDAMVRTGASVRTRDVNPDRSVRIGWTGSHSTLMYLDPILPVLQELQNEHDFQFVVIANKDPKLPLKNYQFIKWTEENEVSDLQQLDIGIMPLENTEWAKGKCGFKLIQYGAVGIPSVASPVGVNSEVLIDEKTGYLASTTQEWKTCLEKLLKDPELRSKMGQAAREHIVANYSVESQKEKFLSLFAKS